MLKKIVSFALVVALFGTLGGTPAFAHAALTTDGKASNSNEPTVSGSAEKKDELPGKSLKADIQKLVADAKAGKGLSVSDPQNQPRQSNGLSKGAKIAIGVGIAAAVILVIVLVSNGSRNTPGRIGIF